MDVPGGGNAQQNVWKVVEEYDDGSQPIEIGRHHGPSRAPSTVDVSAGVQAAIHLGEGRQYNSFGAQINNVQYNIQHLTVNYDSSQPPSENSSVSGPSRSIDRGHQSEAMGDLQADLLDSDTASLMTTGSERLCKLNGIYVNSLLGLNDRGYPLYIPGLDLERPERHKACGISPGDVGFITPEGEFYSLFNILGDNEPANEGIRLPANFTPLEVAIRTTGHAFANAQSLYPLRVDVKNFPRDGMRRFRSKAPEAGILHLPRGGVVQSVNCGQVYMRSYARRHVRDWYEYAKRERKFPVHNGSIYLIDGCDKTNAWGIAVFVNPRIHMFRREFLLDFKTKDRGGAEVEYTWESNYDATTRIDVTPTSGTTPPFNQCTFIRGYKLLLRDNKFNKRPKITISLSHLFGNLFCLRKPEKPSDGSSAGQETNTSRGPENLGQQGQGSQHSTTSGPDTNGPTHPSDVINEYLLQEYPDCDIAITHDDDWMKILEDAKSEKLDLETYELKGSINKLFNVHGDDDVVYLESKDVDAVRVGTDEYRATPQTLEASLKRVEMLEASPVQSGQVKGPTATPSHFQDDTLAHVGERDHPIAEPSFKSWFSGKRR